MSSEVEQMQMPSEAEMSPLIGLVWAQMPSKALPPTTLETLTLSQIAVVPPRLLGPTHEIMV